MATVKDWNGQKVKNGQVYIDEDDKPEKFFESNFSKYAEVINDANGSAHVAQFDIRIWTYQSGEGEIHVFYPAYYKG